MYHLEDLSFLWYNNHFVVLTVHKTCNGLNFRDIYETARTFDYFSKYG